MKKQKKRKKFKLNGDTVLMAVGYLTLILVFVVTLYPMIFVLSASFSDPGAVASGEMLLFPKGFSLDGYKYVLQYKEI